MLVSQNKKNSESKHDLQFKVFVFSGIVLFVAVLCILLFSGCKYGRGGGGAVFFACEECLFDQDLYVYVDGEKVKGVLPKLVYNIVCGPDCDPKSVNPAYPNYRGLEGEHVFELKTESGISVQKGTFQIKKNQCVQIQVQPNGCFPNQSNSANNGSSGNTGNNGNTGGNNTPTTTGSCASMSSYISFVSCEYNACTNNSGATFRFKNTSNQKLEVRVPIKLNSGTWTCEYASPAAGATFDVWTCNSTKTYGTIEALLYEDWVKNCTFSACPK